MPNEEGTVHGTQPPLGTPVAVPTNRHPGKPQMLSSRALSVDSIHGQELRRD